MRTRSQTTVSGTNGFSHMAVEERTGKKGKLKKKKLIMCVLIWTPRGLFEVLQRGNVYVSLLHIYMQICTAGRPVKTTLHVN